MALALGASVIYGVSDFLGGLRSRSVPLLFVLVVSQATALVLLSAAVLVLGADPPVGKIFVYGVLAGIGEAIGAAALYRGLAVGTMSIVAPVGATAAIAPVVVGVALGEAPTAIQAAGIALALGGVVVISSFQSSGSASGGTGVSVGFGLLTALGFGGFLVAMDAASEGGVAWALLLARVTTLALFGLALLFARAPLGLSRAQLPALALIGALVVSADALYALATTRGELGAVAVLSSLYPVVTIVLARVYLHERIARSQQLGAAIVLGGVVAISLGAA